MSDISGGAGWWQAADGKWYPPEQHPDYLAPTEAIAPVPPPPSAPTMAVPTTAVPPPGAPTGRGRAIAIGAVLAAIALVAAILVLTRGGDDDKAKTATTDASVSATDASDTDASDSDATTTTKKKRATTTTEKATTTTVPLADRLKADLLTAGELSQGSQALPGSFTSDTTDPEVCGQPNIEQQHPSKADVGITANILDADRSIVEELRSYDGAGIAAQTFAAMEQAYSCAQGNVFGSSGQPIPATVVDHHDITLDDADRAIAVTMTGEQFELLIVFALRGSEVVLFQFQARQGAGTETLDARQPVVQLGVSKLR